METQDKKKAFAQAEKELKEKNIKNLKEVIKATLEKLQSKEARQKELAEEIKILKADIRDFKEGRLDRIEERQKENPKAKNVSLFEVKPTEHPDKTIVKEHHYHQDYFWIQPWVITPSYPNWITPIMCSDDMTISGSSGNVANFTLDNSTTKQYSSGTYQLSDGSVKMI